MALLKKKDTIGIDIGSSSIKLIELKSSKKGYQAVNFGIAPLPPEAIVDGALMDSVAVVDAISELVEMHKIRTKDVVTSVSGHSVIVKKIEIPVMTEEELADSITFEAERYIPFDINDVNIDFEILRQNPEETSQMEVLLVAVKKDMIDDYISVINEAGLNLVVVDVDAFALQNMFELNYGLGEDEVIALCNIGANVMNINILKDGTSAFVRDVAMGGNVITEEIQKRLGVDYDEAEAMKVGAKVDKENEPTIKNIIETVSQSIVSEISKSLDFFSATFTESTINRLYLSGGCAKVTGLRALLENKIGVPVEIINPFRNIGVSPKFYDPDYVEEIAPIMAVAVGLAIRRLE